MIQTLRIALRSLHFFQSITLALWETVIHRCNSFDIDFDILLNLFNENWRKIGENLRKMILNFNCSTQLTLNNF
jgi:hypothetical protein